MVTILSSIATLLTFVSLVATVRIAIKEWNVKEERVAYFFIGGFLTMFTLAFLSIAIIAIKANL